MIIVTATQINGGCSTNDTVYIVYTPCIGLSLDIKNDEGFIVNDSINLNNGQSTQLNGVVTGGNPQTYTWTPTSGIPWPVLAAASKCFGQPLRPRNLRKTES